MRKVLIAKDLVRVCSSPCISLFTQGGGGGVPYTSLHSQGLTSETADLKETQDMDLVRRPVIDSLRLLTAIAPCPLILPQLLHSGTCSPQEGR